MRYLYFVLIAVLITTISSCGEDTCEATWTYRAFVPKYLSQEEISEEITFVPERKLENPGKIYSYGSYLLISDRETGVHIIDNSDVSNPKKLGFIAIDGNVDIAFAEHYIYADTRYNILVIDIQDLQNPTIVSVIPNIKDGGIIIDDGRFIVDFVETDITETIDCNNEDNDVLFWRDGRLFVDVSLGIDLALGDVNRAELDASAAGGGQGGSLARMALFGGYFYYVNNFSMHIFDVSDLSQPEKVSEAYMEWGVETIFPYRDYLFIGANNGMHIYDNEDPTNPQWLSTFAHANACDPVVVEDDIAYITLRSGNECEDFNNQLDVVDVSDLLKPQLIATYPMYNPYGLAVRDNILYLCEADQGLKVYDVSDVETIDRNQIGGVKEYAAYDVISVSPKLLLMIGEDGFYQFDTQNPENLQLLSSIKIGE